MAVGSIQACGVNNIQAYQPQFKGGKNNNVKEIDKGDYIERHITTEASSGKKWGVGLASFIMAGLGQFINGDIGKGIGFLASEFALGIASGIAFGVKKAGLGFGAVAASIIPGVWSIVDAVKNAKSESVQIVNK